MTLKREILGLTIERKPGNLGMAILNLCDIQNNWNNAIIQADKILAWLVRPGEIILIDPPVLSGIHLWRMLALEEVIKGRVSYKDQFEEADKIVNWITGNHDSVLFKLKYGGGVGVDDAG